MRDLLDDDLAELFPVRPADDVRLARLREQLFAEKPKRRTRNWVGIAAAAVVVVLIAGLVTFLRPGRVDTQVAEMPIAPATTLAEAAALLEVTRAPRGKYRHITYETWQTITGQLLPDKSVGAAQVQFITEVWLPSAKGQPVHITRRTTDRQRAIAGVAEAPVVGANKVYKEPALWSTLCPTTPCHETSLLDPLSLNPQETLGSASAALLSPFTTHDKKASLYRQLAAIPGMRYENGAVSVDGSKISFTIDPKTGEIVGSEERRLTASELLPAGTVMLSVTVTYEWTDQRP
ncbi:hypothetical protein ACIA8G_00285 [Lentzea sp. NPDC051213]|uniref:hypothetical protein n=1 Tax=Lentzea sp. NPDC051213 TaxID=3364126 RepID=UPI0037BAC368